MYREVPDYLRNVVTIKDCKKVMGLWATIQTASQSSLIKEQAERIEKLEAALVDRSEKGTMWVMGSLIDEIINFSSAAGQESHHPELSEFDDIFERYNVKLWR